MLKLMKYEFRKTAFSKIILLVLTAIAELVFLAGVFLDMDDWLGMGVGFLVVIATFGILYVGIESLVVFHRDLNTKQSYMLFLTPNNSYQILGAKVLENGCSIFLTGAFFAALAAFDATVSILYIGGLAELLEIIDSFLKSIQIHIDIDTGMTLLIFFELLSVWLMMVVNGFLAIVLSATVLAGKRLSGLVSFLLYLVIGWACGMILDCIPMPANDLLYYWLMVGGVLVLTGLMYVLTGWIMERRLSV